MYMKYKKSKKHKNWGILLFSGLMFTSSLAFANSWESKNIKKEADNWKIEIKKWKTLHEEWSQKRKKYYNKKFDDNFERTDGKYCDDRGCFEESLFAVSYKSSGKNFEISSHGSFEMNIGNVHSESSNGGQSLEFVNNTTNEEWNSSNFGQSLEYKDAFGNTWESSNRGQSVEFNGISGEHWESSNFGQSLEFRDKNGNTWESSNFGQSVENNGEDVDFDIQEDLFNN